MSTENTGAVWYRRGASIGADRFQVSAHANGRHPDGHVVSDHDEPSLSDSVWQVSASDSGLLVISIAPSAIPEAPPVWFVYVPESSANPVAANLVAYSAEVTSENLAIPEGTVISANRFPLLGVPSDAQVAAIRWYPRDGLIHQVYVRQEMRRRSLGTVMIYAASAFHQAHAWPGRLHGDGRRTDLGNKFAASLRHPQRYAPLTEVQPPMDA